MLRKHAAYRDVAQVVARAVRDHEVAGSSPVIPTNSLINDRGTSPCQSYLKILKKSYVLGAFLTLVVTPVACSFCVV